MYMYINLMTENKYSFGTRVAKAGYNISAGAKT